MTVSNGLRVKQEAGWFVADSSFARALEILSDGAFRLFVWICINAHRPSGRLEATHKELAAALGKSKRALSAYIAELEQKGISRIQRAVNQHARTSFEVTEPYWPYERNEQMSSHSGLHLDSKSNEVRPAGAVTAPVTTVSDSKLDLRSYVASIREMFLTLSCSKGSFGQADSQTASVLAQRGVPLDLIRDALLLGETRKLVSWLNNGDTVPIASLNYFVPVIDELHAQPLQPGYRDYLMAKLVQFRQQWDNAKPTINVREPIADSIECDQRL